MEKVTIDETKKLKSRTESTETMDGIPELEGDSETRVCWSITNRHIKIIIAILLLLFGALLLIVTSYEILSYKEEARKTETRKLVNQELNKLEVKDQMTLNKIINSHLEDLNEESEPDKIHQDISVIPESRELKKEVVPDHYERDAHSFTLNTSTPYMSFNELEYKKISYNCYRKDFFRYNINGTGTNMRFIAKSSKIPWGSSENSGKCATGYYWIYYTPETRTTKIYSMGPYYGHHEVKMIETLFTPMDKEGCLTLNGCVPPIDAVRKDYDWDEEYKFIRRMAYITAESSKFQDIVEFQKFLDKKIKDEVELYDEKIRILSHDPESVQHYSTLKEATHCVYSI